MTQGISIVIAYHNRREQLYRTISSINKTKYDKNKLEIIIVNDASSDEHNIDDFPIIFNELTFNIINIKEKQKKWTNSCIPYNIGFNYIKYDKVIIQNPECYHIGDIINYVKNELNDNNYLVFSCYSINQREYETNDYSLIKYIDEKSPFACSSGWYNHSTINPKYYHFTSAITLSNLKKLNGFDEKYQNGIGFDDDEMLHRINNLGLNKSIIDNPYVLHQFHESVFHYNDLTPNDEKTRIQKLFFNNSNLYKETLRNKTYKAINNTQFNNVENLCILIPFKNREENLNVFVPYMRNFMKNNHPLIPYTIVVVEQCNDKPFNKGILFNAGFELTRDKVDYYVLHDVDQIPISADYSYKENAYHLCVNVIEQSNNGKFINFYKDSGFEHKGGAINISKELYQKANGHSNEYWGWGCIDDDFNFRLSEINTSLLRTKTDVNNDNGYYISLKAMTRRFFDDENYKKNYDYASDVINKKIDWRLDGLNNLKYELLEVINEDGYIRYKIDF